MAYRKAKKKISLKNIFLGLVVGLTGIGLILGIILVGAETKVFSEASGKNCSPKSEKLCRGKEVGQYLPSQNAECEDSGSDDDKGKPICEYGNAINQQDTCVPYDKTADEKCAGQPVGKKFGNKECVQNGTNAQGKPKCQLKEVKYTTPGNLPYCNERSGDCIPKSRADELSGSTFNCWSPTNKEMLCCPAGKKPIEARNWTFEWKRWVCQ